MKKGTCNHPKMGKLARILGIPRHQAVGIMVELWEWVADYAVAGNVGIHTNEDIASGIGWEGEASTLIDALVGSGWVDSCDTNRLIIHDWETGCDEWIKKRIKRINGAADNGCQRHPKSASLGKVRGGKVRIGIERGSGGKPNKPVPPPIPDVLATDTFKATWSDWLAYLTERKKPPTERTVKMQLKKLEAMGHDQAIAAIETSITNGWQGIFEPGPSAKSGQPAAQHRADKAGREFPEALQSKRL
jgi:hypothetical protein